MCSASRPSTTSPDARHPKMTVLLSWDHFARLWPLFEWALFLYRHPPTHLELSCARGRAAACFLGLEGKQFLLKCCFLDLLKFSGTAQEPPPARHC